MYAAGTSGIGQIRRVLRIAEHLLAAAGDLDVTLATGIPRCGELFLTTGCRVLSLSEVGRLIETRDAKHAGAVTAGLRVLVDELDPEVFVSTTHTGLAGELTPVLADLRARGTRRVLALRDIYWPPRFEDEFTRLSKTAFDQVIVGGPPSVARWSPPGLFTGALADAVAFVGYLGPPDHEDPDVSNRRAIWCQVGGGRDGFALAAAFLDATPRVRAERPAVELRLSTGILMAGAHRAALASRAEAAGVAFKPWVVDPIHRDLLCRHATMLSMGGYNTCVESAWLGVPTVVCPRRGDADDEQRIRAELFAARFPNMSVIPRPDASLVHEHLVRALDMPRAVVSRELFAAPAVVARAVLQG